MEGLQSFEPLSGTPGQPGVFKRQSQKYLNDFKNFDKSES
jgi:hypothetical protein